MSKMRALARRLTPRPARARLGRLAPPAYELAARMIERSALAGARLGPLYELARVCRPGGRCFVSTPWVPRTVVPALELERGDG